MMVEKVTVTFAASAVADIEDILKHYSEKLIPDARQRLVAEIVSLIENLTGYPEMGRVVPEFRVEHLRELIHPPFRIVYRRDPSRVRIVRVWRSERSLRLS